MAHQLRATEITNNEGVSLNTRISATRPGQCTWAVPDCGKRCAACQHYTDGAVTKGERQGFGRCDLVKRHTRKTGVLFDGATAWACTLFTSKY